MVEGYDADGAAFDVSGGDRGVAALGGDFLSGVAVEAAAARSQAATVAGAAVAFGDFVGMALLVAGRAGAELGAAFWFVFGFLVECGGARFFWASRLAHLARRRVMTASRIASTRACSSGVRIGSRWLRADTVQ